MTNLRTLARPFESTSKMAVVPGCSTGMVFDEMRADDLVMDYFGVKVLVDPFSADYLRGAVVDYVDSLNSGGFKISNPKAKHSCGCGKSFEV